MVIDNELSEFRLTHPESDNELTFAVEIGNNTYFTQQDTRHQIVKLQNEKGTQNQIYNYSSFQQEYVKDPLSPWRFSNRRQVGELSLFTHRFYNPHQRRWLTPDPIGFVDGYNLYSYNQNNPHRYFDKDGRIAFALPVLIVTFNLSTATITSVALPTITATAFVAATTATILAVREIDHRYGTHLGGALFNHGCFTMNAEMTEVLTEEEVKERKEEQDKKYPIKTNENNQKYIDVYAPDRKLPAVDGVPIPDSMDEHTQLGVKKGKNGKYAKHREFGKNGQVIRDIEFTDHRRIDHPVPHQHKKNDNFTGGTKSRGDPEFVEGWTYY